MAKKEVESLGSYAIRQGLRSITENHPIFEGKERLLSKYLDNGAISKEIKRLYREISKKNISEEDAQKYIVEKIAKYVASTKAFNERGQQIIFQKAVEGDREKGKLEKIVDKIASPIKRVFRGGNEGLEYFENTINAFGDVYNLMSSKNYAERMPEIAEAAITLQDMGVLNTALDMFKSYGVMDDWKYNSLKREIKKRIDYESKRGLIAVEKYILPQKVQQVAAAVLGIFGIGFMINSGNGITGNVIGSSNVTKGIFGMILVIASLIILFVNAKKKKIISKKKIRKKKR